MSKRARAVGARREAMLKLKPAAPAENEYTLSPIDGPSPRIVDGDVVNCPECGGFVVDGVGSFHSTGCSLDTDD